MQGNITVANGGTLNANVLGALPTGTRAFVELDPFTLGGSTLALGASQEVAYVIGASSAMISLGSHTLTIGFGTPTGSSITMSGTITGTGNLVKDGISRQRIEGVSNTYTGTTTIAGGELLIFSDESLGAVPGAPENKLFFTGNSTLWSDAGSFSLHANRGISISSGVTGTLSNGGNTFTINGVISGDGSLASAGLGTTVLNGSNTYSGTTTVNAGVLSIGSGSTSGTLGAGDVVIGSGAELRFNRSNAYEASRAISGAGNLRKSGSGATTLSGGNSFSGTTFVDAGILEVTANNALGSATGGTQVASGAQLRLINVNYSTAEPLALSGTLYNLGNSTFAGPVQAAGVGIVELGFNPGYSLNLSGGVSVDAGSTLRVGGLGQATIGGGGLSGGATATVQVIDFQTRLVLAAPSAFGGTFNFGGTTNATTTIQLATANAFSGPDYPSFSSSNPVSGGVLHMNGYSATIGEMGYLFSVTNTQAATTSTLTLSGSSPYSELFLAAKDGAGVLAITRAGTGNVNMTGNTYSGLTTIQSGSITTLLNGLGSAASGTVVQSGGALILFADTLYTTPEPLTLNGTGISNGGAFSASGTSSFAGPITIASNATIRNSGTLTLTGGLVKDGTTLTFARSGLYNINSIGITGSSPNSDLIVDGAIVSLNAASSYNGPTYVQNGGTLNANVTGAMPTSPRSAVHLDATGSGGSMLSLGASQQVEFVSGVITSAITLGGHYLTVGGTAPSNAPFAGVISGIGGIVKDGTNGWTLSGTSNTYSGSTTLAGGTLGIYGDGSLGAYPALPENKIFFTGNATLQDASNHVTLGANRGISIASGVTATFDATGNTFTIEGTIIGDGNLASAGNVVLTGANSYEGTTTVNSGVLSIGASGTTGSLGAGEVTIQSGGGLRFNRSNAYTTGQVISGAGTLTQQGGGTTTLGGNNSYTGTTFVNAGILEVTANNALGTTAGGTQVASGATLRLDNVNYSTAEAVSLEGTLSNTGTSTFAGAITNNLGTISAAGGTLNLTGGIDLAGSQLVFNGGGSVNITGTGISSSAPDVGILIDGSTLTLGAASGFEGPVFVDNGGLLRLGAANVLPASLSVELHLTDGDLDLNGQSATLSALAGSSFSIISNGAATTSSTLTINGGGAYSFSGVIQDGLGTVSLVRSGSGTTLFEGANTYSGTTTISSGSIQLSGAGRLGSAAGGTTVASGAAIELQGVNYTAAEALVINGTGISGSGALHGTGTWSGLITAATDSTIKTSGTLNLTGGLVKDGTTLTLGGSGTININTIGISGSSANSDLVVDGATVVLNAINSYNGPTTVQNSGTLKLGISSVMPTAPHSTLSLVSSGSFDLNGYSDTIASLNGTGSVINGGPVMAALTVGGSNGSGSFSGTITGDISLNKTGSGIQTLSGASTYGAAITGITTVTQGALNATNTTGSATGQSTVVIDPTGTLAGTGAIAPAAGKSVYLNGTFIVGDATRGSPVASDFTITTSGGGTMSVGSTATLKFDLFTGAGLGSNNATPTAADILTLQGNATFATGSILEIGNPNAMSGWMVGDSWRIWDTTGAGLLTGVLTLSTPNISGIGFWDFNQASGILSITAVPEPSRVLLILLGAITLTARRRR